MIETKGFCALLEAADSALKAASHHDWLRGHWERIVAAFFRGDVAAVKAAIDAGAEAAGASGRLSVCR